MNRQNSNSRYSNLLLMAVAACFLAVGCGSVSSDPRYVRTATFCPQKSIATGVLCVDPDARRDFRGPHDGEYADGVVVCSWSCSYEQGQLADWDVVFVATNGCASERMDFHSPPSGC
jgi:hypothetical protein